MTTARASSELGRPGAWWVIAGAFVIYFTSGGLFNTATVFFKAIAGDLGLGRGVLSGAFSLGFLVAGLAAPLWGSLADRRGAKAAFLPAVVLVGVLCVALSRVTSALTLYIGYISLTLASAGISLVPVSVLISRWFDATRGRAMGVAFMGEGFGAMAVVPLAGYLVAHVGWRTSYVIAGVGVVAILLPVVVLLRNAPEDTAAGGAGEDPAASDAVEPQRPRAGLPSGRAATDSVGASPNDADPAAPIGARRDGGGATRGEAMRTPVFWLVAATWFMAMTPLAGVSLHQVPFLTDHGFSVESASLAAGMVGGTGILGRLVFGLLSERLPIRWIYACCYLFMALGIAALAWTPEMGVVALGTYVTLFGIAVGGAFALAPLQVAHLFGVRALGEVFGLLGLAATLGGAIGGAGAGLLYDRLGSYDLVLAVAVGMSLVATVMMTRVQRPARRGVAAAS
ncbi:MAG: MFS transporter [Deltaproteobacteria bacterium]|nr:MAG: MFS transporter [Deltaproteobacteria bacterium]